MTANAHLHQSTQANDRLNIRFENTLQSLNILNIRHSKPPQRLNILNIRAANRQQPQPLPPVQGSACTPLPYTAPSSPRRRGPIYSNAAQPAGRPASMDPRLREDDGLSLKRFVAVQGNTPTAGPPR